MHIFIIKLSYINKNLYNVKCYQVMKAFKAKSFQFSIVDELDEIHTYYPMLRSELGNEVIYNISPNHGRSYIIRKNSKGRYVVSKGNGLSYTQYSMINTGEIGCETWGLLLRKDAMRDFIVGQEIQSLGIKTNNMEAILEIDVDMAIINSKTSIKPVLLQYNVECPYRINDAAFMKREQVLKEVSMWENLNDRGYEDAYMIAANVLIRNLRIMHDNGILHNAICSGNYSWALELLDFELAHTPNYPYTKEDYIRHVPELMPREIIQTYEVINYIASYLGENINYFKVDNLFKDYNFNLENLIIKI
jgi:hypothetical protein